MRRLAVALALAATLVPARPAGAGDFWDEVRTPGLKLWRATMREARTALRNRRFGVARNRANDAIELLPERAEAYVVRGLAAGAEGQLDAARDDLRTALARDPAVLDDPLDGYGARAAEVLARAGATDDAVAVLARVLGSMRAGGGRRVLFGLYGDLLQMLGPERLDDALRAYREALRGGVGDPGVQLGLALAEHRQGLLDASAATARRAVARGNVLLIASARRVPGHEQAARRAVGLMAMGDLRGARTAWRDVAAVEGPWQAHAEGALRALGRGR
ncbi:MAG: tetratricopeptide repeat protein [Myxococcota bacterium]